VDNDNRTRTLAEVASLDAWHKGFTTTRKAVDLHVDVSFSEGRIGGEPEAEVRFRLRLRRADVVIVVPPLERVGVDKASVSRDAPRLRVKATEARRTKDQFGASAGLLARAGASVSARGKAQAQLAARRARETTLKITQDGSAFSVMQVQTQNGDYAWIIEPTADDVLLGRPWNADDAPRLRLIDQRSDGHRTIEPAVRVELRCRREDLEIREITPTSKRDWAALAKDPFGANKLKAAEAVIRTRLARAGLVSGNLEDPFAELTICAVIAQSA